MNKRRRTICRQVCAQKKIENFVSLSKVLSSRLLSHKKLNTRWLWAILRFVKVCQAPLIFELSFYTSNFCLLFAILQFIYSSFHQEFWNSSFFLQIVKSKPQREHDFKCLIFICETHDMCVINSDQFHVN